MKKLFLSTTFLIAGACGILAQGLVTFDNGSWNFTDGIDRNVYGGTDGSGAFINPISDNTWYAQLWELRGGTYFNLTEPPTRISFFGSAVPGVWEWDGIDRVISVAKGIDTTLQVRIYDGANALKGESAPFLFRHQINDPPGTGDTLMINFRAFAVPEPSTIALGVLGLGTLLLFRRRK